MCSVPLTTDESVFFVVENLDPTPQFYLMSAVNMLSSIVNMKLFYVTIVNSKNESMLYRQVSFVHNFSLFVAQFYWGSILNPIPLLPLPGFLSIGPLKQHIIGTFSLLLTWILLFALSIIMMYVILLIRLRVLARRNAFFHFRDTTYIIFFLVLSALIFAPILSRVLPYNSSDSEMRAHTLRYYPKCTSLAFSPGFFVFVNSCKSTKGVFIVLFSLFGGASLYLVICGIIIHEIRVQSVSWSNNTAKRHIKVLKNTIVQNITRLLFLAIAPTVVLRNAFLPPETDTINLTLFANTMFTAAPIPCAIVIFTQNHNYRNFLASKFHVIRRKFPFGDVLENKGLAMTNSSRKTTLL